MYRTLLVTVLMAVLSCAPAFAWSWAPFNESAYGLIVDPYTATPGVTINSSQLNSRFTTIYTLVNGNIENANIKSGAAVDPTKLNLTLELGPVLRAGTNRCISAGTTGDTVPRAAILPSGAFQTGAGSASALDLEFIRKDANTFRIRNVAASANKNLELAAVQAFVHGDANAKWELSTAGIKAGAGGGSAQDLLIDREDANTFQIRNAGDSAYKDLHIGQLNLETVLPLGEGGTGNGAIGSALQEIRINSGGTQLEGYNAIKAFGGDGGQGAVTKGNTSDTITQINATTFTQTGGTTYTPDSGVVINATSTVTINGTITVGDLANGGAAAIGTQNRRANGSGDGGNGCDNATNPGGGGGGGFGNAGGNGGDNNNDFYGAGGLAVALPYFATGGAGGAGGCASSNLGGKGGDAGGNLRICAVGAVTFGGSSICQANGDVGGNGAAGNAAGGGGGRGGHLGIYSRTSTTFTSGCQVKVTGGQGGAAASATGGVGGGGAGGRVVVMSPSNTLTSPPTAAGGAVGGTGRTTNSGAGGTGVITNITGVPSMPLIAHIEKTDSIAWICKWKTRICDKAVVDLDGREVASWFSALYAKPGKARQLNTALLFGTDEPTLSELTVLDCNGLGETPWVEQKQDVVEGSIELLPAA